MTLPITDPTPAEQRVREAFPYGREVDFTVRGTGEEEGESPVVRAEFLRTLVVSGTAADGAVAKLHVRGARISGALDLGHATVEAPVELRDCTFDEQPNLYGARLRQLDLGGSRMPGLLAAQSQVDGVLRMTGCRLTAPVSLSGAQLAGSLFLDRVRTSGQIRLDGADITDALVLNGAELCCDGTPGHEGVALQAVNTRMGGGVACVGLSAHGTVLFTGARVEGSLNLERSAFIAPDGRAALVATVVTVGLDLLCNEVRAEGEVRFTRCRVGGRVNLEGARLDNPGGAALRLGGAAVGAEVSAAGLRTRGQVKLRGAQLSGALVLTGARLSHPGGAALLASGASGAELWLDGLDIADGHLSLRGATFTTVHAAPEDWPDRVWLDGLTYQALSPHLPPARRLALLGRDGDGYVPYAYEQLAAAYRRAGDEPAARTVQLAKHRHYRTTRPWYERLWGYVQDGAVGYGYRPLRAAGCLLVLLLIGSAVFAQHPPRPVKPEEAPGFDAAFYTLDLLLVVGFGQESAFRPEGGYQRLAYLLIALGWILATTVLTGVSRVLSRQ
ncbi:membrane-associated oxidoreductase [Streptomyces sp. NPDC048172]|uniref:membrane-associated oxidoreductase n=1 Tax=Streptomyces sp. NPDC048172 TaxID=3365505 RepID=UPI00371704C4